MFTFSQLFAVRQQREQHLRVSLCVFWRAALRVRVHGSWFTLTFVQKTDPEKVQGRGQLLRCPLATFMDAVAGGIILCTRFPGDGEID